MPSLVTKTVVFLSNRFFHLYDFNSLKAKYPVRMIAIIDENMLAKMTDEVKAQLDAIHVIENRETGLVNVLDYGQVKDFVLQELNMLGASQELRLICNDDCHMPIAAR